LALKIGTLVVLSCLVVLELVGTAGLLLRAKRLEARVDAARAEEGQLQVELSRLRREIKALAEEVQQPEKPPSPGLGDSAGMAREAHRLLGAIDDLKDWIDRAQPRPRLPEMKYLHEKDWVAAAHVLGDGRGIANFRAAWFSVRYAAVNAAAPVLQEALKQYVHDTGGTLPGEMLELARYLPSGSDPSLLGHYHFVSGPAGTMIKSIDGAFSAGDSSDDVFVSVSLDGGWTAGGSTPPSEPPR
jgi:hypothetical protein